MNKIIVTVTSGDHGEKKPARFSPPEGANSYLCSLLQSKAGIIHIVVLIAFLVHASTLNSKPHQVYARSFMLTRPAYQHLSTQQALWHSIIYNKEEDMQAAARVIGFYQKSLSLEKTAHYFLPPCIDTVLVAGDNNRADIIHDRTVRAEWLGLDPSFRGSFTLNPTERQAGFLVEYNQNLNAFIDLDLLKDYWISINIPFVDMQRSLNLQEKKIATPDSTEHPNSPTTIRQAFQQPAWCYAHIPDCSKKMRPAEIRVAIGSSLVSRDYFQFAYNTILIAPTGNKQTAKETFEAVVGNNQHFAFGAAIFFQFPLNEDTSNYGLCFFTNLESIFNIRNSQHRTLDIKNKPWSRYLLYNEQGEGGRSNIPGVNLLTHHVLVRPYGVFDFSCGWRYLSSAIEAEVGYNVWGKSNERVELKRPYYHPCEYYGVYGIAGSKPNTTASESTIAYQAEDDIVFTPITLPINPITQLSGAAFTDLDPFSAESGSVLNHKVHIAVGSTLKSKHGKPFINGGAYIDIPQKNTTLRVWGIWLSMGASF